MNTETYNRDLIETRAELERVKAQLQIAREALQRQPCACYMNRLNLIVSCGRCDALAQITEKQPPTTEPYKASACFTHGLACSQAEGKG